LRKTQNQLTPQLAVSDHPLEPMTILLAGPETVVKTEAYAPLNSRSAFFSYLYELTIHRKKRAWNASGSEISAQVLVDDCLLRAIRSAYSPVERCPNISTEDPRGLIWSWFGVSPWQPLWWPCPFAACP